LQRLILAGGYALNGIDLIVQGLFGKEPEGDKILAKEGMRNELIKKGGLRWFVETGANIFEIQGIHKGKWGKKDVRHGG